MTVTAYPELDDVLADVLGHWQRILGGNLVGADIDAIPWGQRYAVVTACRTLYTIETAEVASKAGALEWAQRRLDPRWRPLLAQVRDDRARGFDQAPRPGSATAARAFVEYAVTWAERRH